MNRDVIGNIYPKVTAGEGAVDSFNGRVGAVAPESNDYTWSQLNKTTSNIADIATRSHTSLTDIGTNTHNQIDTAISNSVSHISNTSNPHSVTASQVGVFTPAICYYREVGTNTVALAVATTNYIIPLTASNFTQNASHFTISEANDNIVINTAGTYEIVCEARALLSSSSKELNLTIFKNAGAIRFAATRSESSSQNTGITANIVISLAQNDTISFYAACATSGSYPFNWVSSEFVFYIKRIV